jgi:hypothetical protein
MLTTRNTGQDILQDLNYTYDPVGNITEQVDNAHSMRFIFSKNVNRINPDGEVYWEQIHYFSNSVIEPRGMYEAIYQ